jgi:hypothetical protein
MGAVEETSGTFTREKFYETVEFNEYQGNRDYQIFLDFKKWLSKISYKPNWTFTATFQQTFSSSCIQLTLDAFAEVPDPPFILRFSVLSVIPIEKTFYFLEEDGFNEDFLWTLLKSEIQKIEFAFRDKWLKYDGELVV